MSIGIGGFCSKVSDDGYNITYSYSSYNLNESKNSENTEDGTILIRRSSLIEPEVHEKIKRMPNGRKKLVIKRIPQDVPVLDLISEGGIYIKNCSNTWKTVDGYDVVALRLCYHLFNEYQLNGQLPEKWSYHQ